MVLVETPMPTPARSTTTAAAGVTPARSDAPRPATSAASPSGMMSASLSLPDLKIVDRRVNTTKVVWEHQVGRVQHAKDLALHVAQIRQLEANVLSRRAVRSMHRVRSARGVLSTPLPANITPIEYESHATGLREAARDVHADCLRREEIAKRLVRARREATLAADRAEELAFIQKEKDFRVESRMQQEKEDAHHRRYLEKRRKKELNRDKELEERHADKAHREHLRQQRQASITQFAADKRARKEAAEKEREMEEKLGAHKKEEAAAFKARKLAATKARVAHRAQEDYAKRLVKTWRHAERLVARAEDEYERHLFTMRGLSKTVPPPPKPPPSGLVPVADEDDDASRDETHPSWAGARLAELKSGLALARRRHDTARDRYDKVSEKLVEAEAALEREEEEIEWLEAVKNGTEKRF